MSFFTQNSTQLFAYIYTIILTQYRKEALSNTNLPNLVMKIYFKNYKSRMLHLEKKAPTQILQSDCQLLH